MIFDDFLAGYEPGKLEEVRKVQTVGTDFSDLMEKFEQMLDSDDGYSLDEMWQLVRHNPYLSEVLTPAEINYFLQATQQHESHKNYYNNTGVILSRLIQNSYCAGYNDFMLNTKNISRTDDLGTLLIGTEDCPLSITVQGNITNECGNRAEYSLFTLNGTIGARCGLKAKHSTFTYNGAVGDFCGWEAENCTFKTPLRENLRKMRGSISINKGNTLIYIDSGREVRIDLEPIC